jgi:hypothetical protein
MRHDAAISLWIDAKTLVNAGIGERSTLLPRRKRATTQRFVASDNQNSQRQSGESYGKEDPPLGGRFRA